MSTRPVDEPPGFACLFFSSTIMNVTPQLPFNVVSKTPLFETSRSA
jgi:hypothetical protein